MRSLNINKNSSSGSSHHQNSFRSKKLSIQSINIHSSMNSSKGREQLCVHNVYVPAHATFMERKIHEYLSLKSIQAIDAKTTLDK